MPRYPGGSNFRNQRSPGVLDREARASRRRSSTRSPSTCRWPGRRVVSGPRDTSSGVSGRWPARLVNQLESAPRQPCSRSSRAPGRPRRAPIDVVGEVDEQAHLERLHAARRPAVSWSTHSGSSSKNFGATARRRTAVSEPATRERHGKSRREASAVIVMMYLVSFCNASTSEFCNFERLRSSG